MQTISNVQNLHETTLVSSVLSILGGYLDAYTYILKGGVFANAQTGNVVLLSISILSGNLHVIEKYLLPILTFAIGIFISEYLKTAKILKQNNLRIKLILLLETSILITIGFISNTTIDLLITCMISFLAAIQVSTFNKIMGANMATTMITGNLKSSMENLHLYFHYGNKEAGKKAVNYLLIIFCFGAGASLGLIACRLFDNHSIFFCPVLIMVVFLSICIQEKNVDRI